MRAEELIDGPAPDAAPAVDPAFAAMMAALGGGQQVDPLTLLRTQLGADAASNPQAAMIMQLLEQRAQATAAAQAEAQAGSGEEEELEAAAAAALAEQKRLDLEALQETIEQVYAELDVLRTRNDILAQALGACYLCFGEDPQCAECRGRGRPGGRAPEPAAFKHYLLPALRRARQAQTEQPAFRHPQQERKAEPPRPPARPRQQAASKPWQDPTF